MSYRKISTILGISHDAVRYNLNPTAKAYHAVYYLARKNENTAYHLTHKDEKKAYDTAYRNTHKDKRAASYAIYRREHLPEDAARSSARRALKQGALIGATANQLNEIAEVYRRGKESPKVRCYLCGKLIPKGHRHVDHIVPLSKGGQHRPSNLAVACDECNLRKNAKMPNEVGVLI